MPHLSRVLICVALLALLPACGDDDGDTDLLRPRLESGVPNLPPGLREVSPTFASADSVARYAKGMVIGQLNRVGIASLEAMSSHQLLNEGGWQEAPSGCLYRQFGIESDTTCVMTVWICEADGGFTYSQVLDGYHCIPGYVENPPPLVNWISVSGFSNADASYGRFRRFRLPSAGTGPSTEWTWQVSPDRRFVDWDFYVSGDSETGRFAGTLRNYLENPSALRAEFRWSDVDKWDAEVAADGRSGRMSILTRSSLSGTWRLRDEIVWRPAHGTWNTYDDAGAVSVERAW